MSWNCLLEKGKSTKARASAGNPAFIFRDSKALFRFIPGVDYINGGLNRWRVYSWNIWLIDQMPRVCVRVCIITGEGLGHSFRVHNGRLDISSETLN